MRNSWSHLIGIVSVWIVAIFTGGTTFNGFFNVPPPISPVFLKLDLKSAIDVGFYSIVFVILLLICLTQQELLLVLLSRGAL